MEFEPPRPGRSDIAPDLSQTGIYTVRQAAVALGVSTWLVYELLRSGFRPSGSADAG